MTQTCRFLRGEVGRGFHISEICIERCPDIVVEGCPVLPIGKPTIRGSYGAVSSSVGTKEGTLFLILLKQIGASRVLEDSRYETVTHIQCILVGVSSLVSSVLLGFRHLTSVSDTETTSKVHPRFGPFESAF